MPRELPLKDHITYFGYGRNMDDPTKLLDIGIPDEYRSGHVFVSGSTRSGKTGLAENIIEQDIRKNYNVFLIDPKTDQGVVEKIIQTAIAVGRFDDLLYINPMYPEISNTVNPLSHWFAEEEIVGHCISGIKEGKDPFFRNIAKDITSSVVEFIALHARLGKMGRAVCTFNEIANGASSAGLGKLAAQLKEGTNNELPEVKNLLGKMEQTLAYGAETYGKVASSLQVAMHELTSGNIGRIVGSGRNNKFISRINQGKGVILIMQLGSLVIQDAAKTLAKVLLSMIMCYAGTVMGSRPRQLDRPLCIHIDEAQSVMFQALDEAYAKVGASNIWITSYVQDNTQVRAEMGPDRARAIIANHNTKIFLRSPEEEGASMIANHFGVKKGLSAILGFNSITTREVEEPFLQPFDIISLPKREFYMVTYADDTSIKGRYHGYTHELSERVMSIEYPIMPQELEYHDDIDANNTEIGPGEVLDVKPGKLEG